MKIQSTTETAAAELPCISVPDADYISIEAVHLPEYLPQ